MSKSIGIDLGTTNSVAAIKMVDTEILKNHEGDFLTPSCVTTKKRKMPFAKPIFIVGKDALEWQKQNPENTITAIKRLMGRSFQNNELQKLLAAKRLSYVVQPHSAGTINSVAVIIDGKEYSPEEISSKILGKIKTDAEKLLNDKVEYAVITVPAYFNDKQKHATRTAALMAGLKIRRLISEPTAAAISFGVESVKDADAKTVLIFDFGGGTFDLSVLIISGGQFLEQGKGGDMWLGGEDIDRYIMDYALSETAREFDINDMSGFIDGQDVLIKNRFWGELKAGAEKAKIQLETEDEVYLEILGLLKDDDGDSIDLDVTLTRETFDKLIKPIVDSTIKLTRNIISDINFTKDLIDNVLLVGGSSKIPCIIKAMEDEFGKEKVLTHPRPMLAIAEGAAILSHRLAEKIECPQCGNMAAQANQKCSSCGFDFEKYIIDEGVLDIVHSAAHDYYICLENNDRHLFIEKNTPLPCSATEQFKLVHKDQKLLHMKFFNIVNDQEESIGDLWLGIDKDRIEDQKQENDRLNVTITLDIDENNLISVKAVLKEAPDIKLSKTLSRGKADEKLFVFLEKMINDANQKKYNNYLILDLTYRALSAIKDIQQVISPETQEINKDIYEKVVIKLEKAKKLAAENQQGQSSIFYAENILASYGEIIPVPKKTKIEQCIKNIEKAENEGSYEENIKAFDKLSNALSDLGNVNLLMSIQQAGFYYMQTDPSKGHRFHKYIEDIMFALTEDNAARAAELIDEIMPETYATLERMAKETSVIHTDLKR